ncbi:hypothetical protein MKY15_20885 [Sporosarcina sp. FSL K6-1540]|uniref:hypothetical protein n=1 Tax=Sporosarcina sp. FSL K6-1540 TaxID=2921555 RepID=UPI003159E1E0
MKNNYKIIKIIDEYTVIINAGFNQGIEVGDKFQILDKKGSEVKDPDTDEVLGYLDLIKDTVNASEVHEKMSFCTTPFQASIYASLTASINEASFAPRQAKLNIDLEQVTGGLRESDEPIRIGDSVRLIKSSTKQTKE